jgi:site-specific DNA recombinase
MQARRAIGVVRVSETKGRTGDSFASPKVQLERITETCLRDKLKLIKTYEELDVSGGKPLAKRPGLSLAVASIEAGDADVIMVAYFDRLVRSLKVQHEVVERVEQAGGEIFTLDHGQITNGSAAKRLQANIIGAMAQYFREQTAEKSGEAQAEAVRRGVTPWPNIPPGYRRGPDGVLEPDENAPVVAEAFRMRAGGAPIKDVRAYLADHGVSRSYHGVQHMLTTRVVLGEINFGKLVNLDAHESIVDPETWRRAQRMVVPRGPKAKSDRLLARLGVLHCGSCGARMVVGNANHGQYPLYRCPPTGDCKRRVTISAEMVEQIIWTEVKRWVADFSGTATGDADAAADRAAENYEHAKAALETAILAFTSTGLTSEPAAIERLAELKASRDQAQDRHEQARSQLTTTSRAVTVGDPDELDLAERRDLIATVIDSVIVAPGRGPDRISIEPKGQPM